MTPDSRRRFRSVQRKKLLTRLVLTAGVLYGCYLLILLAIAMGVFGVVPLAFAVWVGAKFFTYAWADGGRKEKRSGTARDREKEEKLKQLDTLQKAGLYTEEEFKTAKSAILEERFK